MSGRDFTGTQKHALQVKINNNWTNITHFTSWVAVMKHNCEATIQFGKNDMMCVCVADDNTYICYLENNVNKHFCVNML
jgi:hypothetical protein